MCGINGYLGFKNKDDAERVIGKMNASLAHRGPDDEGIFVDNEVALGHQRLSILDLSSAGHQPMASDDGRYQIVYNGEIYNFQSIRNELKQYAYTSETDTEVILAAYKKWGKACIQRFNGMFAFAIWDKVEKNLFVARDRIGIKPLYYYRNGDEFLFSSEVRALLRSGKIPKKVNRKGVRDFLRYQTVHAPETMVEDVFMLKPGHTLRYCDGRVDIEKYWDLSDYISEDDIQIKKSDTEKKVRRLLFESVERRLISDVPIGAFLSGGIDSSAIVALMSEIIPGNVNTFSVTFDEYSFNESCYSNLVAETFNTSHTEIKLKPDDFLHLLPEALRAMDHPSGDGPNTYVISKETRNAGVTVALSGLGGDEIFAGYPIFHQALKLQNLQWIAKVPHPVRAAAGSIMKSASGRRSVNKVAALIAEKDFEIDHSYPLSRQVYDEIEIQNLFSVNGTAPERVAAVASRLAPMFGTGNIISKISVAEMQTYMQNTLLRDTDQMSMASGLEVRVPFLDHVLVEQLLALPDAVKMPDTPKKLLTDALGDLLPHDVVHRKKMGFDFPWEFWLKNELRSRVEENFEALGSHNIVNADETGTLLKRFLNEDRSVIWPKIWLLFVLQEWIEQNELEF